MKIPKFRVVKRNITDRGGNIRVRGYGIEVVFYEPGYHYLVEEARAAVSSEPSNSGEQ